MQINILLFTAALIAALGFSGTANAQRQLFSDFNDAVQDWDEVYSGLPPLAAESNGQLSIRAKLPATRDNLGNSATFVLWQEEQSIRANQTLEYRVDLVRASQGNVLAGMYHRTPSNSNSDGEGFYAFMKDSSQIFLAKVKIDNLKVSGVTLLFHEQTVLPHHHVILSLGLTGVGDNVRITARVLDKRREEAILFETTVLDTPGIDAHVATSWAPDPDPGRAYVNLKWHGLYLAQFTDGNQPEAEVVYDNFTYEYRAPDPFTKITTGEIVTDARGFFNGAAWGDFDDDGFVDLLVTRVPPDRNILYRNQGDGTFRKLGQESIFHGDVTSATGIWGDADNDGDLDLFVPNAIVGGMERPPQDFFYRNNGDRTFNRVTEGDFVNDTAGSNDASWVDYDQDGWLDLFVANGRHARNSLYRNQGDGTFLKITGNHPLIQDAHWSHGSAWADYDNDGDQDLFVPNILDANNYLFRNDGSGSFVKITRDNPIVTSGGFSDAGAWADYDNDGDQDLLVINFPPQQNALYRNDDGTFRRVNESLGAFLRSGGYGADWADFDNDGQLDLIVVRSSQSSQSSSLYHNLGDGTFHDVSTGFLTREPAEAAAWGDYDNDGFLDLFLTTTRRNHLYHNNGNSNHWIKIKLVGSASNRSAIGAKVRVKATIGGKTSWQLREVATVGSFGKADMRPNFGLGNATVIETVRVEWPSGTIQELNDVAADQILSITEPPRLMADGFSGRWGGEFRFHAIGAIGLRYHLETSADFHNWTRTESFLATNKLTPLSTFRAADTVKFYRLVQEEAFENFDRQVQAILAHWKAPGVVITIVKDGRVLLARGYGTTKVANGTTVTPTTLTSVASVTKTFNAVALAMLEEEGLIGWDDPVKKHIPEFRFGNTHRTDNTTLRDLITHQAGLPNYIGDPWSLTGTMPALLQQLPNSTPQSGFRQRFAYSQTGIALLGEVVRRVTAFEWPEFVQIRILDPLGMKSSYPDTKRFLATFPNPALASHLMGRSSRNGPNVIDTPWKGAGPVYTPAGGLITTGEDMARYMNFLLGKGLSRDRRLLTARSVSDLFSPQVREQSQWGSVTNPFSGAEYCLGWILHQYEGRKVVEHTGSNLGSSVVALLPDEKVGVFVSSGTNFGLDSDRSVSALKFAAFDLALGLESRDWIKVFSP